MATLETNDAQLFIPVDTPGVRELVGEARDDDLRHKISGSLLNEFIERGQEVIVGDAIDSMTEQLANLTSRDDAALAKGQIDRKEAMRADYEKRADQALGFARLNYGFLKNYSFDVREGLKGEAVLIFDDDETRDEFEEGFATLKQQYNDWIHGSRQTPPDELPYQEVIEPIAKAPEKKALREDLLIDLSPETIIKPGAALRGAESLLIGLMFSSSYNSVFHGRVDNRVSKPKTDNEDLEREIRETLDQKLTFEDLTLEQIVEMRNKVLEDAGRHLTALRNTGLLPPYITANNYKGFMDQVKMRLGSVKFSNERKKNIDLLQTIVKNSKEAEKARKIETAPNVGHTALAS